MFILKTKEENQLSQQTIDAILANTEHVVESSVQCLKDKIGKCLANNNIEIEPVDGLGDILEEPCVFSRAKEPLSNEYLQVKYFLENFDLVVSSSFSKLFKLTFKLSSQLNVSTQSIASLILYCFFHNCSDQ